MRGLVVPVGVALMVLAGGLAMAGAEDISAPWNAAPPNAPDQKPASADQTRAPALSDAIPLRQEVIASGFEHPWALAALPDGSWLVTERPGRLRHVTADGAVSEPIAGLPAVDARGQGGLLDLVLSPDFAEDRQIFWSFAEPRDDDRNATAVARGRLSDDRDRVEDVTIIFRQEPAWASTLHFGARLVFAEDGTLFITLGERSLPAPRALAQDPTTSLGKVVHIDRDGAAAADRPAAEGWLPELRSIGHRNLQGAALGPDGNLWTVEHGPRGGDELNLILPGRNYGWPVITYGLDYDGSLIGDGLTAASGMEQPVYYWDPVIAPSGAVFVNEPMFPEWGGDLLIGGLQAKSVIRLRLTDGRVTGEARFLDDIGRVRDLAMATDGAIWLILDQADAPLIRLSRDSPP